MVSFLTCNLQDGRVLSFKLKFGSSGMCVSAGISRDCASLNRAEKVEGRCWFFATEGRENF